MNKDMLGRFVGNFVLFIYKVALRLRTGVILENSACCLYVVYRMVKHRYKNGKKDYIAAMSIAVKNVIFRNSPVGDQGKFYIDNNSDILNIVEILESTSEIKEIVNAHIKLEKYFNKVLGGFILEGNPFRKEIEECETILTGRESQLLKKHIKRKLRSLREEFKEQKSLEKKVEFFERFQKIKITISSAVGLASLISIALLVSGFVYNYIFYSLIGVPVSYVLGIADYISSSIDNLVEVLTSLLVGVGFVFIAEYGDDPKSEYVKRGSSTEKILMKIIACAPVILVVFSLYMKDYQKLISFTALLTVILCIIYVFPVLYAVFGYSKRNYAVMFFIFTFFITVSSSAIKKSFDYKKNGNMANVYFKNEKESRMNVISVSSRFVVCADSGSGILLIPIENVEKIFVDKKNNIIEFAVDKIGGYLQEAIESSEIAIKHLAGKLSIKE